MRKYAAVAAALGLIATWGSENFFWSAPPDDLTLLGLLYTWVAYTICVATALSAVLMTGVRGWSALFLGGAITGWLVEGVVVGTIYEAFPFQLVWTPLAWHALVTGLGVLGLSRTSARWPLRMQVGAWVALGLGAGAFALYWPIERDLMPGAITTAAYLCGWGLVVPLANVILDRIETLETPKRWVLLAAPALATGTWALLAVSSLNPLYLALPAVLALTVWIMRRLGQRTAGTPLALGAAPRQPWRHLVFLVAPAATTVVAVIGWNTTDGVDAAAAVASVTGLVSLGVLTKLSWEALRRDRHDDTSALEGVDPGPAYP